MTHRHKTILQIPNGYTLLHRWANVSLSDAKRILNGRHQKDYCLAVRDGDKATLHKYTVRCPICGNELPLSRHIYPSPEKVGPTRIDDWATNQMSLFGDPNPFLHLNGPETWAGEIHCKRCKSILHPATEIKPVTICTAKHMISLTCPVSNLKMLLSLPWLKEFSFAMGFPLHETVTFNLRKGRIYCTLTDNDGKVLSIVDITSYPETWSSGPVYEAITNDRLVARALRKFFCQYWGTELPYANQELTPQAFIPLTRFIGYPRDFYNAIPYENNSKVIERGFKKSVSRMHDYNSLPALYTSQSILPQSKLIRKRFFSSPAFFFYLEECGHLLSILKDQNLFRKCLANPGFRLLGCMHAFPGIELMMKDIVADKGGSYLCRYLEMDTPAFVNAAVAYYAMNAHGRSSVRKNWHHTLTNHISLSPEQAGLPFSIPTGCESQFRKAFRINGFTFITLSSSSEYALAGRKLHNCITAGDAFAKEIIVVKNGPNYVAAIEVHKHMVMQAYAAHNSEISSIPGLSEAFETWMEHYGLVLMDHAE